MKKKYCKLLRQLAQKLPESYTIRQHTKHLYHSELPKKIKEKLKSKLLYNPNEIFPLKEEHPFEINHYKRLKKAWKQDREKGLRNYIIWLDNHNQRLLAEIEENKKVLAKKREIKQVPKELVEIAKNTSTNFWQLLINFFYSFLTIFSKKEAA